ncbi:MAG: efflux RND transporter permease subunit [Holosporaceae bacterium]|jgi:multidrug efflux pump|nr:efflux RND transporter permease subunit [Holosporaceae bacterium]
MEITEICIRRPVLATVLTLVVVVLGLVAQSRLPVRKDPKVEKSMISVEAEFIGASPKVVEAQITKILEGAFATIAGVDMIKSDSRNDECKITIEFSPERTPDGAASDVRDRLAQIRNQLPHGIPEPIIRRDAADAHSGSFVVFTSDHHSIDDLRDFVEKYVKAKFETLPGVGRVVLSGGNVKTMRVFLDPQRVAAYGYTPVDVAETIGNQHVQRPCGRLISKDREYMLVANGELSKPEEFDEIVLPSNGVEKVVKIKDIGKSKLVPDDIRAGSWFNGKECVTLGIVKQSTANPLDISVAIKKILPEVKEILPTGAEVIIAMDEADDISASMSNVYRAIFEATFLVVLVVFLFLWSFRATLIPIVTIPVSLLGAFALLYAFDFSINTFTLLAMVLAVGLVVDDAIVVLENVHRHMEKGLSRFKAAIVGSNEIFFSIIAMTLTLATAYVPIAMTPGKIGKYFREFALTLSGAVLVSGFVALTLSPMMCSKLLSTERRKSATGLWLRAADYQKHILESIEAKYLQLLTIALDQRYIALGIGGVLALLGMLMFNVIPAESRPIEDIGYISIHGNGPVGASYTFMEETAKKIDEVLAKTPFGRNRCISADTSKITGWVQLVDWRDRKMSSREVAEKIHPFLKQITGVHCSASAGYGDSDKDTVDFILQTNQSFDYLAKYGGKFLWTLQTNYQGLQAPLQSSLLPPQQEYVIDINRDKAASLGISIRDIISTIESFIKGQKAANVQREAKRDELFIQVEKKLRQTPDDLSRIMVRSRLTPSNSDRLRLKQTSFKEHEPKMVPITDLITIRERQSPIGLSHHNQMLSIVGFGNIAKGYSMGGVVDDLSELKYQFLPDTIQLTFSGATKAYLEESKQIALVFGLALIFVFLILAAQFESFIDPFVIMLSVPFSIVGALVLLYVVPNGTLNIYSKVGLITLIGLITKHGILIVDFANAMAQQGIAVMESVKQAAFLRLRPILMTTFAMVIGAIPLALATGAGANCRRQIGLAIVGGMSLGTIFTLFIVPIVYLMLAKFKSWNAQEE